MQNAFYFAPGGKFAQRDSLTQTAYVSTPKKYFQLMMDENIDIRKVDFPPDEEECNVDIGLKTDDGTVIEGAPNGLVEIKYVQKAHAVVPSSTASVPIAAFTTCYARLQLYEVLDLLQRDVLYYDTDSCIFKRKNGETKPKLGDYLGDLADEFPGGQIKKFVSAGPKNYAFAGITETGHEKCVCKIRGFTINTKTEKVLNFETVEKAVIEKNFSCEVSNFVLRRDAKRKIVSKTETKIYRKVYNKRILFEDFTTLPYGFAPFPKKE